MDELSISFDYDGEVTRHNPYRRRWLRALSRRAS
jgi:hypothetical protein